MVLSHFCRQVSYCKPSPNENGLQKYSHCPLCQHTLHWTQRCQEYIWISSNEVDETGAYYTEWSKPERKTPIQYAAKSLQSCPTLCDPIDGSPPGSPVPGILQARTLEWVAISFSNSWKWNVKGKSLSRVWLLATQWTVAYYFTLYNRLQFHPPR